MAKKYKHLENGVIAMQVIKKIFSLLEEKESISEIARLTGIARSTVRDYKMKSEGLGMSYENLSSKSESELLSLFKQNPRGPKKKSVENIDLDYCLKELMKKGVTKQVLYSEYYAKNPKDSISYSAFCTKIREKQKSLNLSMRQEYRAGEKQLIDYSGLKVKLYDAMSRSEEVCEVEIYVSVLGVSNYTYVEATSSQKLEDFISSTVNSFNYYGGVAKELVPDNLKSAVKKANNYFPEINRSYQEMADYYRAVVMPARSRKPKDKAKVETAVKLIQQQILAKIRQEKFISLKELNSAIKPLLEEFNEREMKSYGASRKELFEEIEKKELTELPLSPYEVSIWKKAKVHPDYHVEVDKCYYSVPYEFAGKTVDVSTKKHLIEIYHNFNQIALHERLNTDYPKVFNLYSTKDEHMPAKHIFTKTWSKEKVEELAKTIGENTVGFVEGVFRSKKHKPTALRSLMSLNSIVKKYGKELVEEKVKKALAEEAFSIKYLKILLENQDVGERKKLSPILEDENIRGEKYYH
jgi:transposase